MKVFAGIDVACAQRKQLPVCFITSSGEKIEVVQPPSQFYLLVPRGKGNQEVANPLPFRGAAQATALAFRFLIEQNGWTIERLAIDAPASRPRCRARLSENALLREGYSCIRTPNEESWSRHLTAAQEHLRLKRPPSSLPAANLIWMLYGFELFRELRMLSISEIIEVYPYSIVQTLSPNCPHKTTKEGYQRQLNAIATATSFDPQQLECELKEKVRGSRHDRLDAFMAAWVASFPAEKRKPFGDGSNLDDAIWIPSLPKSLNE